MRRQVELVCRSAPPTRNFVRATPLSQQDEVVFPRLSESKVKQITLVLPQQMQ